MLTDHVLAKMYTLAHCLHPDNGVALAVTLEACERVPLLRRLQDRRTGHYRLRVPESSLPQYCVYLASDARERHQERQRSDKEGRSQLTSDDFLVRYIKFLLWQTMDRNACHVAVALGCFLYDYQPGDITSLAPDIFSPHNIRRVKSQLAHRLYARFQHTPIFLNEHLTLATRPPTEHERQLIYHVLTLFAPWGCPHIPAPASDRSILETHFDGASPRSDWERMHALIDPTCAGLASLIREYNANFPQGSYERFEDPDDNMVIPCFPLHDLAIDHHSQAPSTGGMRHEMPSTSPARIHA
jgi:hypothetical protein